MINPNGNTSFEIYFLAKDVGYTESILYINTNKGIFKYKVRKRVFSKTKKQYY